jgi:type I restriction enzyme M protein
VFYGAGVPACLLILRKKRPKARRDQVLLVYAARHYRDLSAQNELRPQDVMRILVHYHAYGDAEKVGKLVKQHGERIRKQIDLREEDEVERIKAEYEHFADKLSTVEKKVASATEAIAKAEGKTAKGKAVTALAKLEKQRDKLAAKIAERNEKIAESRRRAEEDRQDVAKVGEELEALYADPDELLKHARVVGLDEIAENEFNLNIPRYVDTFEPEPRVEVKDALRALSDAEDAVRVAEGELAKLLKAAGYA